MDRRATPVQRHGALRVEGAQIVDERGRPVVLRGVSLFWSQWQPQYYNPSAVRWLRDDWKADVVRIALGVHRGGYIDHPERETAKVRSVVEAAIDLGLYVIVDWHAHRRATGEAKAFFARVAQAYGAVPNIIYETWNEPLREFTWAGDIKAHHETVIAEIRRYDPANLVVAGTERYCQRADEAARDPLPFDNVAYALHFYAASHKQGLRERAARALAYGAALMATEWGVCESTGDGAVDAAEVVRWWRFLEENGISYVNWSISDKTETSAALKAGASAEGGWPDEMISPSGLAVREHLQIMHAQRR